MHVRQTLEHLGRNRAGGPDPVGLGASAQVLGGRDRVDVLHREVEAIAGQAHLVEADDPGVIEPAQNARLAEEQTGGPLARPLGQHDLQRRLRPVVCWRAR